MGAVHALDILGDPVRRRIVELLADGELAAGEVGRAVQHEFGITQPAVSQHLKVLREAGFASVRSEGTRRSTRSSPSRSPRPPSGSRRSSGSGARVSTRSAPSSPARHAQSDASAERADRPKSEPNEET